MMKLKSERKWLNYERFIKELKENKLEQEWFFVSKTYEFLKNEKNIDNIKEK